MLRAALIGFPASGKTTLFQLMTSARDAPRGKGDVNIEISLAAILAFLLICLAIVGWIFRTGYRLKS